MTSSASSPQLTTPGQHSGRSPQAPLAPIASPPHPSKESTGRLSQRFAALDRANETRMGRALLKRAIAEGRLSAAQVILDCPREAHSLGVHTLLTWQRQWGTIRARKLLARMPIPEKKAVGQLTDRQRRELVAVLGHRSNGAMEGEGDGI